MEDQGLSAEQITLLTTAMTPMVSLSIHTAALHSSNKLQHRHMGDQGQAPGAMGLQVASAPTPMLALLRQLLRAHRSVIIMPVVVKYQHLLSIQACLLEQQYCDSMLYSVQVVRSDLLYTVAHMIWQCMGW